jgi:hypothetical protein
MSPITFSTFSVIIFRYNFQATRSNGLRFSEGKRNTNISFGERIKFIRNLVVVKMLKYYEENLIVLRADKPNI